MAEQHDEQAPLHWGHIDARPTSLHGNGASALGRITLNPSLVDCRLCVTLLATTDALSWAPETAPFPREHVEKKWGPPRLVDPRIRPAGTDA